MRECSVCPPAWLPPTPGMTNRVVRCAHFDGQDLYLYRHFDLPDILVIAMGKGRARFLFRDEAAALRAFEEQERVLMGREA